jgi:hypothetical protein
MAKGRKNSAWDESTWGWGRRVIGPGRPPKPRLKLSKGIREGVLISENIKAAKESAVEEKLIRLFDHLELPMPEYSDREKLVVKVQYRTFPRRERVLKSRAWKDLVNYCMGGMSGGSKANRVD